MSLASLTIVSGPVSHEGPRHEDVRHGTHAALSHGICADVSHGDPTSGELNSLTMAWLLPGRCPSLSASGLWAGRTCPRAGDGDESASASWDVQLLGFGSRPDPPCRWPRCCVADDSR